MSLPPTKPPASFDDELVDRLLELPESDELEFKRVGDNTRKLQTIVAFASTRGGILALGIDDADRASGRERVYGIDENLVASPEAAKQRRRYRRPGVSVVPGLFAGGLRKQPNENRKLSVIQSVTVFDVCTECRNSTDIGAGVAGSR